jgi:two-component system, cell cycle sensor histidine kinase and response regulator CckA
MTQPIAMQPTAPDAHFRILFECCPDGVLVIDEGDLRVLASNQEMCRRLGYTPEELTPLSLLDIHPRAAHARVESEIRAQPGNAARQVVGLPVVRKDGGVFFADVSASRIELDGRPTLVAFFRDTTERTAAEERTRIKHDLMQALAATSSLAEGLRLCVDAAVRTAGCDGGGVYLRSRDSGGALDLRVHLGLSPEFVDGSRRFAGESREHAAALEGEPVYGSVGSPAGPLSAAYVREGVKGYALLPLVHDGHVVGCLVVASRTHEMVPVPARLALETIAAGVVQAIVRLQAEEELRESQERYRVLFDEAVDGLMLPSADGSTLTVNKAFARMHGYETPDEMASFTLRDLDTAASAAHGAERVRRAEAGETLTFEVEHYRKDRSTFPLSVTASRVRLGGQWHVLTLHRDITESRRAERALQSSERQLRLALEAGKIGVFEVQVPTGESTWSLEVAEIWGIPSGFAAGFFEYCWEHVHPDDLARVRDFYTRFLQGGPTDTELRIVRPGGETRWIRWRGRLLDDGHTGLRVVGVNIDITERRRLEEDREAALLKYRTLFDALPIGISVADREGRLVESNRMAGVLLGLPEEEQRQRKIGGSEWQIVRPDGTPMPPEEFASTRAFRDQHPVENVEMGLVKSAAETTWLSVTAAPLALPDLGVVVAYGDITDRKRATDALAEREEVFANVIEQATDAIAVVDAATGRFVQFNEAAHRGLGYTREEFATLRIADIQAEHSPEAIRDNLEQARAHGAVSFDTRHRHRDGSVRDERVSIRPLRVRGRDYMAAVWTDITDRNQAAARELRDALRTEFLLDVHQRAPQMSDRELFDHFLQRAVELTASAIGFFHRVSDDQQAIILTTWNEEARRGCATRFDTHYPLADAGNWVDCVRQGRPVIYNDFAASPNQRGLPEGHPAIRRFMSIPVIRDGKVRIIFGVGNKAADYDQDDATQLQVVANELHKIMTQRAAQDLVRESEERFRQIVEAASDWIWEVDADGRYVYASARVTDVIGFAPDEVLGKTAVDFTPEAEAQRLRPLFESFAKERSRFAGLEIAVRHKDGRERVLEATGVPLLDEQGALRGFLGMNRDVTERKRLEEQFRQSQKLEAVGQLAGGVAHDFNNILAAFMMHLGLLEMNTTIDDEVRGALRELGEEARRAASLTRQLLMFSRRSVLALRPLDLNDVIAELLKMLRRLIGEHVSLRFDPEPVLPQVEADAGLLEQVLMNLVVNARDAMPGGGQITIATTMVGFPAEPRPAAVDRRRRSGRFVSLAVSDTGHGIDAATIGHIFEPFFTTKAPGSGTGLGLATVHGIVAQHNGWVDVESDAGRGSTFRVYLPALGAQPPAEPTNAAASPIAGGHETILVVEDEPNVRQLVTRSLRRLGYRVYEASTGRDALRVWEDCGSEVSVLLTDMVMPGGMSGLALAETLRARKPTLRVVVVSGYSSEVVRTGLPGRADMLYLPKPFSPQALAEVVRRALTMPPAW